MNARKPCRTVHLPGSAPISTRAWRAAAVVAGLAALPGRAVAEPVAPPAPGPLLTIDPTGGSAPRPAGGAVGVPTPGLATLDGVPGRRVVVDTPRERYATPFAQASPTLYLNRCSSGCVVTQGNNDARNQVSSIPTSTPTAPGPSFLISEYRNAANQTGSAADAEWNQLVRCLQEVYSPYNLTVTDVQPPPGTGYNEAIIAGTPDQIGQAKDVLGVAPLASDCSAIDDVISFSFANAHGVVDRVNNICWTAAQESAHAYGLDHEYTFVTGNAANNHSACNDPMTYRNDCGGQKFFRNEVANCGETANRACHCGGTQNSHLKVLSVFGASTAAPIVARPTSALVSPASTDTTLGFSVVVNAGAQRGVSRVEVYFNGFKWAEQPGAAFAARGQPNPSPYSIAVPTTLPNSIVDVKAIAYDDLGASTESAVVTVTKGAACTTATTCAKGQKCDAGKCFWDKPAGELGAACSYPQFCVSGLCTGTADQQICTQPCVPGSTDSCPSGFECVMNGDNSGVCFFSSSGGCCSVDRGGGAWWLPVGLGLAVLGLVARPRRRRR